jgi:hypothetical protein
VFMSCSVMGSRVEGYFPVQRIAQACLQCRYAKHFWAPLPSPSNPHLVAVAGVVLILAKAEEMPV